MIDLRPLCPPADPVCRARSRPRSRFTSSTTTMRSSGAILKNCSSATTAPPLRFMNVSGLASTTPAWRARATSASMPRGPASQSAP